MEREMCLTAATIKSNDHQCLEGVFRAVYELQQRWGTKIVRKGDLVGVFWVVQSSYSDQNAS